MATGTGSAHTEGMTMMLVALGLTAGAGIARTVYLLIAGDEPRSVPGSHAVDPQYLPPSLGGINLP